MLDWLRDHTWDYRIEAAANDAGVGTSVTQPAGWFEDPENPSWVRYFDGTNWTEHVRNTVPVSPSERQRVINLAVQQRAAQGWELEAQTPDMVIMRWRRSVNHVMHAILSILTLGLWLLVWFVLALVNSTAHRESIAVDQCGNVTWHSLGVK